MMNTMPQNKTKNVSCTLIAALFFFACTVILGTDTVFANSDKAEQEKGLFTRVGHLFGIGDDAEQTDSTDQALIPQEGKADLQKDEKKSESAGGNAFNFARAQKTLRENPPIPKIRIITNGTSALSDNNARIYKEIFQLQQNAHWDDADALIETLTDIRLRGHILYQRFMHPTAYTSSFDELRGWLDLYADHPGAENIYKLALSRKPADFEGTLQEPRPGGRIQGVMPEIRQQGKNYRSSEKRSYHERAAISQLNGKINRLLQKGAPTYALKTLNNARAAKFMDDAEIDQLKARIAKSYYHFGKLDDASRIAREAADRSGDKAPLSGWVAGLTAWRSGEFTKAARYFEITGSSEYASGWTASAGAYWAARAHMRSKQFWHVTPWMKKAASYQRTFYGLIANRALGRDINLNWVSPEFNDAHEQIIAQYESGWRALSLIKIGEVEKAEAELIHLNPGRRNTELQEALIAFAQSYQLPNLSLRLGHAYPDSQGRIYEAALYPLMSWEPRSGYKIDRALIHAFIRQESRFEIEAQSHSGATGLMQLMLRTASYVDGQRTFKAHNRHLLEHPSTNLDLGQKYIKQLLSMDNINGDLLSLAIAYNAGPGNLRKWKGDEELAADPLLFIESIPLSETRTFVERVLSNFWIYRMRLNQETPSLTDIAQDQWPIYRAQDSDTFRLASAN